MPTTFILSCEELNKLSYERYHYPCPIIQKRLKAATGYANAQIGIWMDAHRNSISQWVQQYIQGGLEAVT